MRFLVLMSKPETRYGDTPTSYTYPARYRQFFEPLERGEPAIAIIYEPLGRGTVKGRKAYVGWAALRAAPEPSRLVGEHGEALWTVTYVGPMQEFPNPVPRDPFGEPIETWLRDVASADRDVRTSGASVRFISESEAKEILDLGFAGQLGAATYEAASLSDEPSLVAEDRARRLVGALERDARFRRSVLSAYEYRCAVSGFGIGRLPVGRATRLLEAAHIRPVADHGPDMVTNGLVLTPTLHRLFDQGLFTLRWEEAHLEIVTSPYLEPTMIASPDGSFRLPLATGLRVALPVDHGHWPNSSQVRYHQSQVFKGPGSAL